MQGCADFMRLWRNFMPRQFSSWTGFSREWGSELLCSVSLSMIFYYHLFIGEVGTIRNETTYPIHGKYPLNRLGGVDSFWRLFYCCVAVVLLLCDSCHTIVGRSTQKLGKQTSSTATHRFSPTPLMASLSMIFYYHLLIGEVRTIRNETTYPIHGKYPLNRYFPWIHGERERPVDVEDDRNHNCTLSIILSA